MADDASTSFPNERRGGQGRGGRGGAPRGEGPRGEGGGFRIRLSDNEMQAARALQEAFGLRSTVAVLGFALRTLAQQLEQGQLDELVSQQRSQAASRGPGGRSGDRPGDRRGGRPEGGGAAPRVKVDPFARPSRPQAASAEAEEALPDGDASDAAAELEAADDGASIDAAPGGEAEIPASDADGAADDATGAADPAPVVASAQA